MSYGLTYSFNASLEPFPQVVLAEPKNTVALCPQPRRYASISLLVATYLRRPEFAVRLGDMAASRAAMPEATIYEYCQPMFCKIKVGTSCDVLRLQYPTPHACPNQRRPQATLS